MNAPLNIDLTQILLHMLNFVILFGALTLILYKPVMKFLKERRAHYEELEKINNERTAECERLKAEYEEKLKSVDEKASEARREAEALAAENAKRYIEKAQIRAGEIVFDGPASEATQEVLDKIYNGKVDRDGNIQEEG